MNSLEKLLDVVERAVDSRTGIIHRCFELEPKADEPKFFYYYATASNCSVFSENKNSRRAGGASLNREAALAKAVGEAIERYASALYSKSDFPLASIKTATFKTISSKDFNYYTQEQLQSPNFPYVPFTDDTVIRWTPAIDLASFDIVYVPAASVWMPYYYDTDTGELPIIEPISTGMASHWSFVEATLVGLLEVIERDSFTITWQGCLSHPKIAIETLSEENYVLVRKIEAVGYELHLVNATMDLGIPVIIAVAYHNRRPAPPIAVAAAAHLNPEVAVKKALEELVHTARYMRDMHYINFPIFIDGDWDKIREQFHHIKLWTDPAMLPYAQFLTQSSKRISFEEIPNLEKETPLKSLKFLIEIITAAGFRPYAVDLTTPDIAQLGLHVVRSLIPGLHPLVIGHKIRARNCQRLYEVPQKLGFPAIEIGKDNPIPHPFP